jgi:hypothetical protein
VTISIKSKKSALDPERAQVTPGYSALEHRLFDRGLGALRSSEIFPIRAILEDSPTLKKAVKCPQKRTDDLLVIAAILCESVIVASVRVKRANRRGLQGINARCHCQFWDVIAIIEPGYSMRDSILPTIPTISRFLYFLATR